MKLSQAITDITMRDYFAAAALTGLLANDKTPGSLTRGEAIPLCWDIADDMINEREKGPSVNDHT